MKPRKYHIRCDLEGVGGVVRLAQVDPRAPEYPATRVRFMAELRALLEGLAEGGAEEISIYDEHWFGHNIDLAALPPGVAVFAGKPPYQPDWAGGLEAAHTGLILHGLHSMAGSGYTLAHTYEPDFAAIHLNGRQVGEIGLETAVAGDWGVPLALLVADSAGIEEARRLVPGVPAVATKISGGYADARCLPPEEILMAIREAAETLARQGPVTKPWHPGRPVEMLCSFLPGPYLDALRRRYAVDFVAEDTLRLTGPGTTAVWADYWQRKLQVQRDLRRAAS